MDSHIYMCNVYSHYLLMTNDRKDVISAETAMKGLKVR